MHGMELLTIAIPLLLVIDPFGNLPFVLAVLGDDEAVPPTPPLCRSRPGLARAS